LTPTPQQQAIYEAVAASDAHLLVEALAGTGKTTTAVGALSHANGGRLCFVAFNKHIADELRRRLPATVQACTLHSLGFATLRRALPGVELDELKLGKIARRLAPALYPSERQTAEQLARLCKGSLAAQADEGTLLAMVDYYGLECPADPSKVLQLAGQLIETSAEETRSVDFDDMVWLPIRLGLRPDGFDLLLADEAQDLNRAQQELARLASRDGRLVPVGDRNQAIYGFAGADCGALPRLAGTLGGESRGCRTLPLTVTWRCPASHVALAGALVPALEAAPDAVEGVIRHATLKRIAEEVRPGDLVICRKNAPVLGLTYRLVLAGVPALMRGRDVGKGLTSLIARLKPASITDLIDRLADYQEREERRLIKRNASPSAFQSLDDRCECLGQLAAQAESLDALERFIRQTFDDAARPGASVVLGSIHRAKGLEARRVYVLDPDSLPLIRRDSKAWEIKQERNLCYIAATRAKAELVFEDRVPSIYGRNA
jgi:DNA helicase-2/ATP-dependent DNA helicase PcrA